MELAEFVAKTLVDVVTGVRAANATLQKEHGFTKRPFVLRSARTTADEGGRIEFDVALTVSNTESGGGSGGIQIAVLRASVGGEERRAEESVTRIKFMVTHDPDAAWGPKGP